MKPFDIELAKQGKPVCTRDGRPVRILCYDFKSLENTPIMALIRLNKHQEGVVHYYIDGKHFENGINDLDLMMATEKKKGWFNIYKNSTKGYYCIRIYLTEQEAIDRGTGDNEYICTKMIEWEE